MNIFIGGMSLVGGLAAVGYYVLPSIIHKGTEAVFDGVAESVSSRVNEEAIGSFTDRAGDLTQKMVTKFFENLKVGGAAGSHLGTEINKFINEALSHLDIGQSTEKLGQEAGKGIERGMRPVTDSLGKELEHFTSTLVDTLYTNTLRNIRNEFLIQHLVPICASIGLVVGTPLVVSYLYYKAKHNIGKPKLATVTRKTTYIKLMFSPFTSTVGKIKDFILRRKAPIKTIPVFNEEITRKLDAVIASTVNLLKNGGFLQNILLYGPGGTGKTMIAETIAMNSNMDFIIMSGGDLAQYIHRGEHVSELNKLMDSLLKSSKPTILFIDEAESLCKNRDHLDAPHTELLNIFLKRTGTSTNKFMLILATNRLEDIDPAVLSRMDYKIAINPPALPERARIIETSAPHFFKQQELGFFSGENAMDIAKRTEGLTGRALYKMLNAIFIRKAATTNNYLTDDIIDQTVTDFVNQEKEVEQLLAANEQLKKSSDLAPVPASSPPTIEEGIPIKETSPKKVKQIQLPKELLKLLDQNVKPSSPLWSGFDRPTSSAAVAA